MARNLTGNGQVVKYADDQGAVFIAIAVSSGGRSQTPSTAAAGSIERTVVAQAAVVVPAVVRTIMTGQMLDGSGTGLLFRIQDDDGVDNSAATLATRRTGADNTHALIFQTANAGALAARWSIEPAGTLLASTDNTEDIGATGTTRPRSIFAATSVQVEADGAVGVTTGLCLTNQTVGGAPVGAATGTFPVNVNGVKRNVYFN